MFSIKIQRVALISLLLLFVFTTLIASVPNVVSAAPYSKDNSVDKAKAWLFGRAVGQCFREKRLEDSKPFGLAQTRINESSAKQGKWFHDETGGGGIHGGVYVESVVEGKGDDSKFSCENEALVSNALEALGYGNNETGYIEALCDMGFSRDSGRACNDPNGGDFFPPSNDKEKLRDAWGKAWSKKYLEGKTMTGSLTDSMRFWIYSQAFTLGCGAKSMGAYTGKNQPLDDHHYKVAMVEGDKVVENYVSIKEDANRDIYPGGDNLLESDDKINCKDLAEKKLPAKGKNSTLAKAFSNEMKKDETLAASADSSGLDGSSGEKDDECLEGKGNSPLSWFGCAALQMLDEALAWLDARVHELLFIDKNIVDSIKPSWVIFRNFAYIILIPLMLVMVIGTAVGVGIFDAYTVKKALPRMLAAVIFIALSFSICSFFINVTNIVGNGVGNILLNSGEKVSLDGINGAGSLTTGIFVAGVVYGFAGNITLGVIGSLALVSAVGLFIGLVTILLREILLVILVVLAPIAILVWIFPGNDKLWTMWKTTFIAMLMMYPLIVLLIASGQFLAGSLNNISVENGDTDHLRALIAMIAYVAPFFMIPATFKYGLGVFGNLAGMVNDKTRGFFDKQRKFREASRQKGRQKAREGNRFTGGTDSNWRGKLNKLTSAGVRAPEAILSSGNTLRPGQWASAVRNNKTGINNDAIDNALKDPANHWLNDDLLARRAFESNTPEELRAALEADDRAAVAAGKTPRFTSPQALDDAVNAVQTTRRTMDPQAFQQLAAIQAVSGGTAYGEHETGAMLEALAVAGRGDASATSRLVAKARDGAMKAGRIDQGAVGFGTMLGEVTKMQQTMEQGGTVTAADRDAAAKAIHRSSATSSQAGQALYGKPASARNIARAHAEKIQEIANGIGSGAVNPETNQPYTHRDFHQAMAAAMGLHDAMSTSGSPQNAQAFADELMGAMITDPANPNLSMSVLDLGQHPAITTQAGFAQMRGGYAAQAYAQAQLAAQSPGPTPQPGGNPVNPPGSDFYIKTNITYLDTIGDIRIYRFNYIWDKNTVYVGVIAQELLQAHPEAVHKCEYGYYVVDYASIGLRMVTLDEWNECHGSIQLTQGLLNNW